MAELQERLQNAIGDTYRLEKELGGGGMSRVFLAEEVRLGRRVVIKVLPPEMGAGVNVERFEREVQLAAQLQHPHIVPLLTAGAQDDLLYYVMPYIKGESLRAKLAREGELPIGEAVRILRDVADALASAHREGVIHRDIKPDNVLLSDNHALVTDFGVAKAVSESTGGQSLTSLGVALGTPAYMSPEQAAANPNVDYRADLYAVGALAYEMLCGQPPFSGPNPQAVLTAHVTQTPEPCTARRASVPPALNEIVMRCLEKLPADRYQKADDLRAHFESMTTPSGGITPTGTQPVAAVDYEAAARRAHPLRVAGLFGLASIGALAVVYSLIQLLGLPDWVFLGALGLLAVGLPIVVLTGHLERRRAIAQTTGVMTATPSGVRRHFTMPKAVMGGAIAFAGLGVVTAAYMAMRVLGIGPVGTLVAAGVLEVRDPVIVAEFENHTQDSTLGSSITQALQIDLGQSPVVKLVDPSDLAPALERMNRSAGERVNFDLAYELAQREGYKAIVTGDISPLGTGYVLSARLVSGTNGETLVPVRQTAEDATSLIPAVDRLSATLRERIGESLKSIRAAEPLARVTTSSLEALQLYSRALQADQVGDTDRAITLLEEAVATDSLFAMAYRKLGVVLSNEFRERSRIDAALTRAFELRDRLPANERYHTIAYYYNIVEPDADKAIDAYRSALEINPDDRTALNNLAVQYMAKRRLVDAEQLYRRAIAIKPIWQNYTGLTRSLVRQGRWQDAESTLVEFEQWDPGNPRAVEARALLATAQRDYDRALKHLSALQELPWPLNFVQAASWEVRGQLRAAEQIARASLAEAKQTGNRLDILRWALWPVHRELRYGENPESAAQMLEELLDQYPLERLPPADRPYQSIAELYAAMGRPEVVRRLRDEWENAAGRRLNVRLEWDGLLAMAEERYADAIAAYRAAYEQQGSMTANLHEMARAYEANGQMDSALAVYERAVSSPEPSAIAWESDKLGPTYKRLGELYETRGDRDPAVDYYNRFVDLWANADPELQPLVEDVRGRIARLVGER